MNIYDTDQLLKRYDNLPYYFRRYEIMEARKSYVNTIGWIDSFKDKPHDDHYKYMVKNLPIRKANLENMLDELEHGIQLSGEPRVGADETLIILAETKPKLGTNYHDIRWAINKYRSAIYFYNLGYRNDLADYQLAETNLRKLT